MQVLQFTDDVYIFSSDKKPQKAIENLEKCSNQLTDWFTNLNLYFSHSKFIFCVFSNSKAVLEKSWSLKLDSETLYSQKKVNFLGVIFQTNLKWNSHIEAISKSCILPLKIMNFLCGIVNLLVEN